MGARDRRGPRRDERARAAVVDSGHGRDRRRAQGAAARPCAGASWRWSATRSGGRRAAGVDPVGAGGGGGRRRGQCLGAYRRRAERAEPGVARRRRSASCCATRSGSRCGSRTTSRSRRGARSASAPRRASTTWCSCSSAPASAPASSWRPPVRRRAGRRGRVRPREGAPAPSETAVRRCGCGRLGCLEAYTSGVNVAARVREEIAAGARTAILALVGGDLRG